MQFGRSYEEFEVGATYKHWPGKTVTEYDDHLFCLLTMNHHPLHLDANYAEETTQFGKNVVVGNYVYSILLGMSVADVSGKAIANLEVESLRHVAPTFHGDTLYGETTVLDKTESQVQGRPRRRPRRDHRLQPGRQDRVHLPPQGDGAQGQLPRGRAAASSPAARCRSPTRTGPARRPEPTARTAALARVRGGRAAGGTVERVTTQTSHRPEDARPARRPRVPRPAPAAGEPVRRRDVGALQLLRHAGDPRDLPVLLGDPAAASGITQCHRDRHRRGVRRWGLPLHDPRRLARRPGDRPRAHPVLRRRRGDARPRRAWP